MKVDKTVLSLKFHKKATNMEEADAETTKRREEKITHSICSFQSRMGPPEYRKWRRIHGLQFPLHPQQIAGWVIFLAVGAATFLVLIPALPPMYQELCFAALATLFSIHILSHLVALLLDPADPELRALKMKFAVPEFDRSKHAHVIENGRCHLCNIKTSSPKTKHCSVCNKCVDHFDHHCKWLNHCIGGRNYVPFLICVVTAVAASFVIVGVSALEIVYYHVSPDCLNVFASYRNETASQSFLRDSVFIGIVSILGVAGITSGALLLHLCLFHFYISLLGITTYEYIRNYRHPTAHRILPWNCNSNCKKGEVLSNHVESSQRTSKSKFDCCYSFSRPPEDDESSGSNSSSGSSCCFCTKSSFSRTKDSVTSGRLKPKKLERQNTDPEFVDRVIKPFLIPLGDEKAENGSEKETVVSCRIVNERKCGRCNCGYEDNHECNEEIKKEGEDKDLTINGFFLLRSLRPKLLRRHSTGMSENSVKIKCNQVRPSTADDVSPSREKIAVIKTDYMPEGLDLKAFTAMQTKVLPELNDSLKRLRSTELKELSSVLDLVDQPNFGYRKVRKKNLLKRPRSPLLSPIRESGLSNPGSPRVDQILPPTPVFVRPPTPPMIFLSNPNSSSSSDDDEVMSPPIPIIHRHYNSEDILKTPQLSRKVFSNVKDEQIFVLKPAKFRSNKWIDVEIRN